MRLCEIPYLTGRRSSPFILRLRSGRRLRFHLFGRSMFKGRNALAGCLASRPCRPETEHLEPPMSHFRHKTALTLAKTRVWLTTCSIALCRRGRRRSARRCPVNGRSRLGVLLHWAGLNRYDLPLTIEDLHGIGPVEGDLSRFRSTRAARRAEGPLDPVDITSTRLAQEAPLDPRCPVRLGWLPIVETADHRTLGDQCRFGASP